MVDFWDFTYLLEDIQGLDERLKALAYAEQLEEEHMQGENPSTLKGHLRMMRIKFLLIEWLSEGKTERRIPKRTPTTTKKPTNEPKKKAKRKLAVEHLGTVIKEGGETIILNG